MMARASGAYVGQRNDRHIVITRLELTRQRCSWIQMSWRTKSYKGNSHASAVNSVPLNSRTGTSTSICPSCRNRRSKRILNSEHERGPYLVIETNNYGRSDNERPFSRIQAYLSHQTMSISDSAKTLGRRFGVSKGITKESNIASGLRKFTFRLSLLTALLSFSAGIFCLQVTRTPRTTDPDQMRFATENAPDQGTVSLAQAIQALGIRH
jgi:hypothetical protein